MNTPSRKRFRSIVRCTIDPWSQHNLNLIRAACDVALRKHGLHVNEGFNYGQNRPKKGEK